MSQPQSYERLPSRDGLPILGNTLELFDDLLEFQEACSEQGSLVRFELLNGPGVLVAEPDVVKQVLVTDQDAFTKGWFTEWLFDDLGRGLFIESGETWQHRRLLFQPSFRPALIQQFHDRMVACTDRVAATLDTQGPIVPLEQHMKELSLSVLVTTLFGLKHEDALYDQILAAMPHILNRVDSTSLNTVLPVWIPTPRNRRFTDALDEMHELIDELVARRRQADTTGDDLLSVLVDALENDPEITHTTIRDDMIGFMIAGHDTTALSLTYAIHLLATHPDCAARLRAELDAELGGAAPTFAQFDDLPYLDRVITETLRLYPPAASIVRESAQPVEIGGYQLPAGTTVMLSQWLLHHDDRYFEEPWTFRPDRWTDGFDDELPEYAYFPFGGGPRHCIGMRFAMAELKIALSRLIQRFEFDPAYETFPETSVAITLQPDESVPMKVRPRS